MDLAKLFVHREELESGVDGTAEAACSGGGEKTAFVVTTAALPWLRASRPVFCNERLLK